MKIYGIDLQGNSLQNGPTIRRVQVVSTATGAVTCDWSLYDEIQLTLTGNVTLSFTAPPNGGFSVLQLKQDGNGQHTVSFPNSVRYNPIISTFTVSLTPSVTDKIGFSYNQADGKYDVLSLIQGIGTGAFFTNGVNVFFNQSDYTAYTAIGGSGVLGNSAQLVSLGITDAGGINGTYTNSSGILTTKTTGTAPRLNYVGGQLDSLIAEPAYTALCHYNLGIGSTGWSAAGNSGCTVTLNQATAPDGNVTATKLAFLGSPDDRCYHPAITVTSGIPYTISCWLWCATGTQTCRLGSFDSSTLLYGPNIVVTTTPTRYSYTYTPSVTTAYPYVANQFETGNANNILAWGMQMEPGQVPSSFVPSPGAGNVTRSATAITSSYSFGTTGTFVIGGVVPAITQSITPAFFTASDGTANNIARVYFNGSTGAFNSKIVSGGTGTADFGDGGGTAKSNFVIATRIAANNMGLSRSGRTAVTATGGVPASALTTVALGDATAPIAIRRFGFTPTVATDVQLAQISGVTI